jgi:hypothetical protein
VAFVRTKRVDGREYKQLVENYRESGEHRQRVLAHLGQHETVEGAIAELRTKWASLAAERDEHLAERARYREYILERFSEALEKHHGGKMPKYLEVVAKGGPSHLPVFGADQASYRSDFGPPRRMRLPHGVIEEYDDYSLFQSWVGLAERHQEKASKLRAKVHKLYSRIEKLRTVQSRGD